MNLEELLTMNYHNWLQNQQYNFNQYNQLYLCGMMIHYHKNFCLKQQIALKQVLDFQLGLTLSVMLCMKCKHLVHHLILLENMQLWADVLNLLQVVEVMELYNQDLSIYVKYWSWLCMEVKIHELEYNLLKLQFQQIQKN